MENHQLKTINGKWFAENKLYTLLFAIIGISLKQRGSGQSINLSITNKPSYNGWKLNINATPNQEAGKGSSLMR